MVSINYNNANSSVLASLRQINSEIAENQTRIGTGLKINKSSDNPSLYATAQTLRSNIKAQDGLTANIGIAKSRADVAIASLDKISDILTKMSDLATSVAGAAAGSTEAVAAYTKLAAYKDQIADVVAASTFQAKSLLTGTVAESVAVSNEASATVDFTGEADVATGTKMALMNTAIGTTVTSASAGSAIAGTATQIKNALTEVAGIQSSVASWSELLGSQLDFQTTLKGINQSALSSIVDANMEEEAARSSALQVKQQLAYQALSIGNSSASNILRLFQ